MTELERLRKERGLTKKALAETAQLSTHTIARMEMSPKERKGGISIASAVAVARVLDVDLETSFPNFVLNPTQGRPAGSGCSVNLRMPVQLVVSCPGCGTQVSTRESVIGLSECCTAKLAA